MRGEVVCILVLVSSCVVVNGEETEFKLCKPKDIGFGFFVKEPLVIKALKNGCSGCKQLQNCTTYEGSVQLQIVRNADEQVMNELRFPRLTEITGHLLISLVHSQRSLKEIFPNLAVIRGRELFLDYSLVIYENKGLEEINLPSLTTILNGAVRIEKNINLCYVNTIRWKSIMRRNSGKFAFVSSNNNDACYDTCYEDKDHKLKCTTPPGHTDSPNDAYCWGPGTSQDNVECQYLCNHLECGDKGCLRESPHLCCHKECLGGCSILNSPRHCYACSNFRQTSDGECVLNCPSHMFEIDGFKCEEDCPSSYHKLEISGQSKKCVKTCPAGYESSSQVFPFVEKKCLKCSDRKCPIVCNTVNPGSRYRDGVKPPIESLASLDLYEGCTEINGNLMISIRGSGGSGIGTRLDEKLGKIEKVKGYIVIRESSSLTSLNFLKNLKEITPERDIFTQKPELYKDRYAIAILDNPKLEALWPFQQNFSIREGGIMVHLNPHLCPNEINPLVDDFLKWNRSDNSRSIDISDSTNGNAVACSVLQINVTLTEIEKGAPGRIPSCGTVCIKVEWDEIIIDADYRNVLFYTVAYRETLNRQITEYDDQDACSKESEDVWTHEDFSPKDSFVNITVSGFLSTSSKPRKLVKYIGGLKHFTLYAFQVRAVVLTNKGAKSDLVFIQTKENVPSLPVGLEANYINSSALLVKWQPPLYPNGNITKYIVTYEVSTYSPWKQDLNWCNRQFSIRGSNENRQEDEKNSTKTSDGNCVRNFTCKCDTDQEDEVKPERQAAIFAKEFQDKLLGAIFNKKDDDDSPTNIPTTTPGTSYNHTNCSSETQDSLCQMTTVATTGKTTVSYNVSNTSMTTTPLPVIHVPTTALPESKSNFTYFVNGTKNSVTLTDLKHFSDYTVTVCACTKVGCAKESSCGVTKGTTDKKKGADDVGESLHVYPNKTGEYYLKWTAPPDPNGVVLKYEIEIRGNDSVVKSECTKGEKTWLTGQVSVFRGFYDNHDYSARVRAITPAGNGSWSNRIIIPLEKATFSDPPPTEKEPLLGAILGSSLAASLAFVLACGFLVWYISRKVYKRYSDEQIPGVLYASVNPEYMTSTDVYIADEWEVPREKIKLVRELGNGSFGMVYEGEAEDLCPEMPHCRVAVKTVSENASIRDRVEFLQEASVMKEFSSNHVVKLLGVVSEGQPTLVIMELMERGDLKNFLRSRRPGEGSLPAPTLQELLQMAGEIADGMAYLANRKYVHRDLAARNCMVNADFTVKIGDFGMTRDIYETDYYRKGGKGLLPVRWMAPESLKDGVFTSNSDVWSFGVVLWEMATLACQPYAGKSNEEVLKYVVDGGLMERPEECPEKLYEMMTLCWQFNPKHRPTFVYLISLLERDLSDIFHQLSFFHTLTEDHLKGLLSSHYKHKNKSETEDPSFDVDSAVEKKTVPEDNYH